MKKPKLHPDEKARLKALENLKIMDTLAEREFDEITLMASQICQTPIALISLVDHSRQWFKSKYGISEIETPKDIAFCAHAILQDDLFLIPDASLDKRFEDNPLVTGATNVQFYAGYPLKDPITNLPIGTLCVIDRKPRKLEQAQLDALKALANQVVKLLELRVQISLLKAANERLAIHKTAFDNMLEGMTVQDQTGKIIEYNPAALKSFQLTAEQFSQKTFFGQDWLAIHENGTPFSPEEHPAMVALKTGCEQTNVVIGIKTGTNEDRWLTVTSSPIFHDDSKTPTLVVSTFADITNTLRAQQALAQSAKLTALGEMACGIAHEINSPLAIISSSAFQAAAYLEKANNAGVTAKLNKIEFTTQRIAKIVRGLKTFSRNPEHDSLITISFKQAIIDATSLCTEKFNLSEIELTIEADENIFVSCIPTLLSQVILNLLSNSFDAVENQQIKWIKIQLTELNDKALLKITDSGPGISREVQDKIMQPFFTTKPIGKGTGLGLSISRGIVNSFSGQIYYESGMPHTCFVVELPFSSLEKIPKVS